MPVQSLRFAAYHSHKGTQLLSSKSESEKERESERERQRESVRERERERKGARRIKQRWEENVLYDEIFCTLHTLHPLAQHFDIKVKCEISHTHKHTHTHTHTHTILTLY